ncbi:hypothetical protein ACREYJ_16045 [Pseudomonas kribbensis]|uniref:hypothetical protein n=1 Tax=Pseudomonas kribbensis TaxID=1628086 RepID=UPI003D77D9D6
MKNLYWLSRLKQDFDAAGSDSDSLYELIEAAVSRGKISFPALLHDASKGLGVTVGEGFFYSLDQDWDEPELFDNVSFFLGGVEISSMAIPRFVFLMRVAGNVYSDCFPSERDKICSSLDRLEKRYLGG